LHCVNTVFMKPKFWHLLGNFILLVPCLLFLSWCFFYQQCFMFQIWRTNQLWPRHCLTSFYLSPWTSMIEDKSDLSPSHQACVKGQGQRLWWSARGCMVNPSVVRESVRGQHGYHGNQVLAASPCQPVCL